MSDNLFGDIINEIQSTAKEPWEEHWKGMPEFKQEDMLAPFSVLVNFETEEDLISFSKLIDQKLTHKTRSIWFPQSEFAIVKDKRYADEP